MRGNLLKLVIVVSLFGSCRGLPQPAALPDAHHMRVGQLQIHSDFELPKDHRIIRELVAERDNISRTLELPAGNETIDVHLFADGERYAQFLQRYFPTVPSRRAFFLETDSRLVVYAHWSDHHMAEDLRHEVAHGYLHAVVPQIPLWLDEGLAEYFEVPAAQNGLNAPHLALLSDMMQHDGWQPDLGRLERLRDATQMDQRDYAESWAWVYAMLHSEPEQREVLTSYLAELYERGMAEPISHRLASHSDQPEQTLATYLAELKKSRRAN
jgi:hypothetical protein